MNKKYIGYSLLFVGVVAVVGYVSRASFEDTSTESERKTTKNQSSNGEQAHPQEGADTIEVVHFHGNQQCISCVTVGEYALKTIEEKFPEEYKKGIIVFKEINGELPENREMVQKYQARGSSLFVKCYNRWKRFYQRRYNSLAIGWK